jgi:hypothetical protein
MSFRCIEWVNVTLRQWLDESGERNRDNVSRTQSYLELYAWTVERPPDFPWLLMAHLVSRNAGYWMTDLASRLARAPEQSEGLNNLFLLLERANFLIFHDAWRHVLEHLLGNEAGGEFMRRSYSRYRRDADERGLVHDLVTNEQNYIERRVVHHPRYALGLDLIRFIEASGKERPISFPFSTAEIRVGGFEHLDRRIATGHRIYAAVLADRSLRARIFEWALAHPHTGDRAVAGGKPSPALRDAWPFEKVEALEPAIHADPEPDASWP